MNWDGHSYYEKRGKHDLLLLSAGTGGIPPLPLISGAALVNTFLPLHDSGYGKGQMREELNMELHTQKLKIITRM